MLTKLRIKSETLYESAERSRMAILERKETERKRQEEIRKKSKEEKDIIKKLNSQMSY